MSTNWYANNYQADEFPSLIEANVSLALLRKDVQLPTKIFRLCGEFLCNTRRNRKPLLLLLRLNHLNKTVNNHIILKDKRLLLSIQSNKWF